MGISPPRAQDAHAHAHTCEADILNLKLAKMEAPARVRNGSGESQYVLLLRNLLKAVKQAPRAYTDWVEKNPEQASKLETVVRVLSYIVPGTWLAK